MVTAGGCCGGCAIDDSSCPMDAGALGLVGRKRPTDGGGYR